MTTLQDGQIGIKKEVTFKTYAVPDMFPEYIAEDIEYVPTRVKGAGLRKSRRFNRSDRHILARKEVTGSFTTEATTKLLGKLFEAVLGGTGTSTNIAGASYQQLFTPTTTDPLDSYTVQVGVAPVGGGAVLPHNFLGCVFTGFEFTLPEQGAATIKWNIAGSDFETSTALATASYPTAYETFGNIHASMTLAGSVTVPTTTALATGGTATALVRDFNLTYENSVDQNGFNIGGAGARTRKPALGLRMATGSFTAEFETATIRDYFINNTDVAITLRLQTTTAISGSNYPTLEFTLPITRLSGETPKINDGDVTTLACDFEVFDGGVAAHPLYVAIVTAETAI
jgi:hypothetical protein